MNNALPTLSEMTDGQLITEWQIAYWQARPNTKRLAEITAEREERQRKVRAAMNAR